MKVHVLSIHPLMDNRIGKHIKTIREHGFEVEYTNASDSGVEDFTSVEDIDLSHLRERFNFRNIKSMHTIYKFMKRRIGESDSEIIHIHDIVLLPLVPYAKRLRKKVVYDKHETYEKIEAISTKILTWYEFQISNKIDAIVYTAEQQEEFIYKAKYEHSVHIPNYQMASMYINHENGTEPDGYIRLVYIGSLSEKDRNILLMLDVYEKVMRANPRVKCTLGGRVYQESVKRKVENLTQEFPDRFEYLGVVPYKDVIEKNTESDIGFLFFKDDPNTYNSSSNKLYEYLLSGLVFIGVGVFVLGQEITENNAGVIFDFKVCANQIAERVLELCADEKRLQRMKKNSHRLGSRYTWESIEGKYISMYSKLIKGE